MRYTQPGCMEMMRAAMGEEPAPTTLFGIPIVVREEAPVGVTVLALLPPVVTFDGNATEVHQHARYVVGVDHGIASGSVEVVTRVYPDGRIEVLP